MRTNLIRFRYKKGEMMNAMMNAKRMLLVLCIILLSLLGQPTETTRAAAGNSAWTFSGEYVNGDTGYFLSGESADLVLRVQMPKALDSKVTVEGATRVNENYLQVPLRVNIATDFQTGITAMKTYVNVKVVGDKFASQFHVWEGDLLRVMEKEGKLYFCNSLKYDCLPLE